MEGELKAAIKMHDQLRKTEFAGLRVGLLHGRMSADDKDATMASFQRGEIDVLVSTTVIEVGVDVPNAIGDGDRTCRALRTVAAAPIARTHRTRRGEVVLRPDDRRQSFRRS